MFGSGGNALSRRIALFVVAVAALALALPTTAGAARKRSVATDGHIVVFKDSVRDATRETEQREREDGFRAKFRYRHALKGFAANLSRTQVAELKADPEVDYVVPNRVVRATATGPLANGELVPPGVQRIRAASADPAPGTARPASSVGVAVIDTGIDLGHPDLNAVDGKNCVTPGAPAQDDNGHGTHVAGSIAARNEAPADGSSAGVVGVAPGTTVHAVKVLNAAGSGSTASVICGIDWATANFDTAANIKVANMSLGGGGTPVQSCSTTTDPEHQAICRSTTKGVAYAVAAGNDGWDFDYSYVPDTPAAYPQVVTVSAMGDTDGKAGGTGPAPSCRSGEADDRYASFSNYASTAGGRAHTMSAPGVCIRSTYPRSLPSSEPGYDVMSGTSMATPHVAGALALCKGEAGSATPGPCGSATAPGELIPKLTHSESTYGFGGDPNAPVSSSRYYGYQALAGDAPPPAPTFALSASPSSRTLRRGQSTYYDVTVNPANGFDGPVTMSVSGLRSGTTASFSPNPTSSTSRMTVRASSSATKGTFTLTIRGVSGGIAKTKTVTLSVTS